MKLDLEPKLIWKHFEELTRIPRCSKHEERVAEYVMEVARNAGCAVEQDDVGNVIVRKEATGTTDVPMITVQAHLDMVCEKNSDVDHDFSSDPLDVYVDGDMVKARGTTLGADNGVGVAAMLALMETDVVHGPLEFLFTVDEETGMTGAFGLEEGALDGDMLINVDSEEIGSVYIGCAGGANTTIQLPVSFEKADGQGLQIKLRGLSGGHSGTDIYEGRANSIKLLARLLFNLDARLCSIEAGDKHNAIPREATAVVIPADVDDTKTFVKKFEDTLRNEYAETDPNLAIETSGHETAEMMDTDSHSRALRMLLGLPHGVLAMDQQVDGLVETSTNMAVVRVNDVLEVLMSSRSSVESKLDATLHQIRAVAELADAAVEDEGRYPGWKPNLGSELLQIAKDVWMDMYNEEPAVKAIHAGLEPGVIKSIMGQMETISIGPQIEHPHSPDEVVYISSVQKFWDYLLGILKHVEQRG
jgi:dipeptidase D